MSDEKTIATMRLVGGHPCLDFVNTVDARRDRWGPDLLRDYRSLVDWALRVELIDRHLADRLAAAAASDGAAAHEALHRAKALREALYAVLQAEAAESAPPPTDVETLSKACTRASGRRVLRSNEQGLAWMWTDDGDPDAISHRVAAAAAEFLVSRKERRPVRECFGPNCGWLFLDTSRGGHRRWCADATCGAHMRVRRFRESQSSKRT